ncbi:DNA gyrase inhibitor YacG [Aquabacterium sp. J223]|uniref:DNA gyrase inhibitor YacG n=1 Tax=Aquabacterium sp. J223 TaxID=2898431 RepID=UPI0021ADB098|nr:DNA gyrase inhibitor YacG [Aquabacterium sp. J223]UUX95771.1 DNA gyrase inhibitor YacG [Aquabacterium sp. J223]
MAPTKPAPVVPCPQCGQPSRFAPDNRWRPFCSERCRSIDLGAWASESYRVPASPPDPTESGRHDEPPERSH